jgi:Mg2+-importing ATPase
VVFWTRTPEELFADLASGPRGIPSDQAAARLSAVRPLAAGRRKDALTLLLAQFASPIVLILLAAAALSFYLGGRVDALIILGIVAASALLSFAQEYSASRAVEALAATVHVTARVVRGGAEIDIPAAQVVPGDVVLLSAGDAVPGDCLLLESRDLFVDEAALTGESFPAEKEAGPVPADGGGPRRNALFLGTHVVSGFARALVARAGMDTEFGGISARLRLRPPETGFERGVRRFGNFLLEVTLVLVLGIFAFNVALHRPVLDSLLFALALAVGLTPQLLPAIISVNLAHGARRMAKRKVIVRRLSSIEDFGSMDVLCCDKTGTLTEGTARVRRSVGCRGDEDPGPLRWAYLNAVNASGFANPIDAALRALPAPAGTEGWAKLDEVPYDFSRRLLSVLLEGEGGRTMVTKGALPQVLAACATAMLPGGDKPLADCAGEVRGRLEELNRQGFRLLGVAVKQVAEERIARADEQDMAFLGAVVLEDPPKQGVELALAGLRGLGVSVKVITGDNRLVASHVGRAVGMADPVVLTGTELAALGADALRARAPGVDIFAEIEPQQKERIVLALKKAGGVVGFLGDGINDAPALHAADVGISAEGAVDAAREAADVVLLEKDLAVLAEGIRAGRTTFANTLKYVFMATSANFGNMFSMAGASLFLPFLPLLPKQILFTNLLTDFPEMTIAGDRVDPQWTERPRRWDISFIRRFMAVFGVLSSLFDYATFAILVWVLRATPAQFRTGWFVESVVSASAVVLVIRTRGPAWKSPPGRGLLFATGATALAAMALPFTPLAGPLGFVPLPPIFLLMVAGLVAAYLLLAEGVKKAFYRGTLM